MSAANILTQRSDARILRSPGPGTGKGAASSRIALYIQIEFSAIRELSIKLVHVKSGPSFVGQAHEPFRQAKGAYQVEITTAAQVNDHHE